MCSMASFTQPVHATQNWKTTESGITPSYRHSTRYIRNYLAIVLQCSTLIGLFRYRVANVICLIRTPQQNLLFSFSTVWLTAS